MATTSELLTSRSRVEGSTPSVDLVYSVSGTTDDAVAVAQVETDAPTTYESLPLNTIRLQPKGPSLWEATVTYRDSGGAGGGKPPGSIGALGISFDISGQPTRVIQAWNTTSHAPPGKTAPDFGGGIGFNGDSFDGADVIVPNFTFSVQYYMPIAMMTTSYMRTVGEIVGKINMQSFYGFDPYEVLFLSMTGSLRSTRDYELSYRFAVSPNKTDLTVGDIDIASKEGWQYLWVLYRDSDDAAAKQTIKKPVAAYVEDVYNIEDFSRLGIGT